MSADLIHQAQAEASRIVRVGLSGIAVLPSTIRSFRQDKVAALAQSMKEHGLLNPVTLRPREGLGYYLIAGRHRLEAARKLKWEGIPAILLEGIDAVEAELCEIDENLIRAELTPAEQAAHHARRKQLYEQRHPKTRHGGDRKSATRKSNPQNADLKSYTEDAAQRIGKSRDTIERSVKRGVEIPNVAELAGTSLDQGAELDALAKLAPERQREVIEKAKSGGKVSAKAELKKEHRAAREAELGAKQIAMPTRQYGVILEDYEWDDEVWSRNTGMDRHASNHYPTSTTAHTAWDIYLATKDRLACAAPDCVLFSWTTIHHAGIAFALMAFRGFEYKSQYVWAKPHISLVRWTRSKHEILLVGTRGNVPCPAPGTQWESLVPAPHPGPHSAKPDCFYEMIEAYFPSLPKIELNARRARPGWASWGLDAPPETAEAAEAAE